ncbi:MAG: DUF502 domain-containing protein [Planctomycetaceae bacterium]
MAQFLTRTFLRGLAVVVPIAAAAYVVFWLAGDAEELIKPGVMLILPERYYVPGLGLVLVVVGTFCVGLLMYPWLTRVILQAGDTLMRKIPIVGMVYSPIRDVMDMFGGDVSQKFGQVVMVTFPGTKMEILGFIMQNDLSGLPEGFSKEGHVVVYLQMSYQIGGYALIVPEEAIRPVDMPVQQAIRWVLMAGVSGAPTKKNSQKIPKTMDDKTESP